MIEISEQVGELIPDDHAKHFFDSDCYFFSLIPGEVKVIGSDAVLRKTVENLKLSAAWGVSTNQAVRILRHRKTIGGQRRRTTRRIIGQA